MQYWTIPIVCIHCRSFCLWPSKWGRALFSTFWLSGHAYLSFSALHLCHQQLHRSSLWCEVRLLHTNWAGTGCLSGRPAQWGHGENIRRHYATFQHLGRNGKLEASMKSGKYTTAVCCMVPYMLIFYMLVHLLVRGSTLPTCLTALMAVFSCLLIWLRNRHAGGIAVAMVMACLWVCCVAASETLLRFCTQWKGPRS